VWYDDIAQFQNAEAALTSMKAKASRHRLAITNSPLFVDADENILHSKQGAKLM